MAREKAAAALRALAGNAVDERTLAREIVRSLIATLQAVNNRGSGCTDADGDSETLCRMIDERDVQLAEKNKQLAERGQEMLMLHQVHAGDSASATRSATSGSA